MLELHHLDEICVPLQILVHVLHHLVFARDVLHLHLVFVRSCSRVFPQSVRSHRDVVDSLPLYSIFSSFIVTVVDSFLLPLHQGSFEDRVLLQLRCSFLGLLQL